MFDKQIVELYKFIRQQMNGQIQKISFDLDYDIKSSSKNLVSKIINVSEVSNQKIDLFKLENIVFDFLISDLNKNSNSIIVELKNKIDTIDLEINKYLVKEAGKNITKEDKIANISEIMNMFDSANKKIMSSPIKLDDYYATFSKVLVSSLGLYSDPYIVANINKVLDEHKDAMEQHITKVRNDLLTYNYNLMMEEVNILQQQTNLETQTKFNQKESNQAIKSNQGTMMQNINNNSPVQVRETSVLNKNENITSEYKDPIDLQHNVPNSTSGSNDGNNGNNSANATNGNNSNTRPHQILNDGTIVIEQDSKPELTSNEKDNLEKTDDKPLLVQNKEILINNMRQQMEEFVIQKISYSSVITDNTINSITNELSNEIVSIIGEKTSIVDSKPMFDKLEGDLKNLNTNFSANIVRTFNVINDETINQISKAYSNPESLRNQIIGQCLEVYRENTSLSEFGLDCSPYFDNLVNQVSISYGIDRQSPEYQKIAEIVANKKSQVETQMYNMYVDFSNNCYQNLQQNTQNVVNSLNYATNMQIELTPELLAMAIQGNLNAQFENVESAKMRL